MPYINKGKRWGIADGDCPETAGELNYALTVICHQYWRQNGENYQAFNDIIGALEGCKMELYRRRVAPYEDKKIEENGDVEF